MSRSYLALGPNGLGSYALDPETRTLVPADGSPENLLIPGFVDVHIHGAFGVDFMSAEREDLLRMLRGLEKHGYEALLPTTVTASAADVKRALANLPEDPMVLGFHLEGPFISPKFPGAQPPNAIVAPPEGPSEWDEILDDSRMRLITLAPEIPGATRLVERLHGRGVIVSMGHTNATYAESATGHAAGVTHSTHTYNAMRPLHHREAGTVGFCLNEDGMACEIIYDRLHVSPEAAAVLIRCKPQDKLIAVSDSTLASGIPAGQTIRMWGLEAIVGQGQVRLPDGTLAGSAITLLDAFRNLHADFGPEIAIRACSINPRLELGMDPNHPRVWIELDPNLNIVNRHQP